jgi:GntR family transcriptional repressor for pyruvate dehydrogenase complex
MTSAPTATEAAINELERLALEELQPGDFLPSEARLAERLGISRLTVREATRALEARGYVELHKGRRPKILAPSGSLAGDFFRSSVRRDPSALLELLQIRRALEVHIAAMAATSAPRGALAAMDEAVAQMERDPEDQDAFHAADIRFHEALAAATGNTMLTQLIEQLAEPLLISRRQSYEGHRRNGEGFGAVIDAHRAILRAVQDGDAAAAANAMRQHLTATERDLRATMRPDTDGRADAR